MEAYPHYTAVATVLGVLKRTGEPMRLARIQDELLDMGAQFSDVTVRWALKRLIDTKQAVRVTTGLYGLEGFIVLDLERFVRAKLHPTAAVSAAELARAYKLAYGRGPSVVPFERELDRQHFDGFAAPTHRRGYYVATGKKADPFAD